MLRSLAFKCTYNDRGEGPFVGFAGTCSPNKSAEMFSKSPGYGAATKTAAAESFLTAVRRAGEVECVSFPAGEAPTPVIDTRYWPVTHNIVQ